MISLHRIYKDESGIPYPTVLQEMKVQLQKAVKTIKLNIHTVGEVAHKT